MLALVATFLLLISPSMQMEYKLLPLVLLCTSTMHAFNPLFVVAKPVLYPPVVFHIIFISFFFLPVLPVGQLIYYIVDTILIPEKSQRIKLSIFPYHIVTTIPSNSTNVYVWSSNTFILNTVHSVLVT